MLKFVSVLLQTMYEFLNSKYRFGAAALSFISILALVPLLIVTFFIATHLPLSISVSQKIHEYLIQHMTPDSSSLIQDYLLQFTNKSSTLSIWGVMFVLVSVFFLLRNLEGIFNVIWNITKPRHGLWAIFLYLLLLIAFPVTIALSIIASSYLLSIQWLFDSQHAHQLTVVMLKTVSFMTNFLGLFMLYTILPNRFISFRVVLIPAILVSFLFVLIRYLFTLYITSFHGYQIIYGAISALPIFCVWIYISWSLVMFGALLSKNLDG